MVRSRAAAKRRNACGDSSPRFPNDIGSGIEVVITGLTRNQFAGNCTWVRIPPAAPRRSKLYIACSDSFQKSECAHFAAPPLQTGPAYPQGARRIRKAAEPPTAAQSLDSGLVWLRACPSPHLFRQRSTEISTAILIQRYQDCGAFSLPEQLNKGALAFISGKSGTAVTIIPGRLFDLLMIKIVHDDRRSVK